MNSNLQRMFKGKKVFITGHTGFKGSWLSFWLTELGAEVFGYALSPDHKDTLFTKLTLSKRMNHIIGDIRDYEKLKKSLLESRAEFVFHFAAQSLVRRSYQDPLLTLSTNVIGSAHLLEAVRSCEHIRSLIYVTSDKCYCNKEWVWGYRENDELGGTDPYSASKASAEHIFKSYYLSYFKNRPNFGCGSTRAGNVIGGGDRSTDRIVPDIIRSIEEKKTIILRSPEATRPWQHVLDPIYGYLLLAMRLYQDPLSINGEAWNFGPTNYSIRTVLDLTKTLVALWGDRDIRVELVKNSMHEARLLHLSIEKAQSLLGWFPRFGFEKAVHATGKWYQRVHSGENAGEIMKEQLTEFMGLL